jgi:hypothetical protein
MWIVIVILVVVTAWLIAGGLSQNSSPPAPPPFDNCAVCRRIDAWWASLDVWGRIAGAAWYALQKLGCAIKGCNHG